MNHAFQYRPVPPGLDLVICLGKCDISQHVRSRGLKSTQSLGLTLFYCNNSSAEPLNHDHEPIKWLLFSTIKFGGALLCSTR